MDRRHDLEMAMYDLPSQNMTDVALKLSAHTDCGNDFSDDGLATGKRLMKELVEIAEATALMEDAV